MTPFAAIVLAHADPQQVHRLVGALEDVPIVLHCDRQTAPDVYAEMTRGLPARVELCPRVATRLSSWSLVAAEMQALRLTLDRFDPEYIAVLSGSCYPLVSADEAVRRLVARGGGTWLLNRPMPNPFWSSERHPDGGMWRLEHHFFTRNDQVLTLRGIPIRTPWRRSLPVGVVPTGGSQWKVYSALHARGLLDVMEHRPDIVRFWRHTFVPDESFVPSMLASPALFGKDALEHCPTGPMYMRWAAGADHPAWLDASDLPGLATAAERILFARKFHSERNAEIIDAIDTVRTAGRR